jgi:flavin reductase (DIM6/NTAB) family NADH-FMN oxidoreductase RutF
MIRTSTSDLKDTPKNIFREKELVINFVHEELADKVNLCSTETPFGDDEFILSGLTPIPSENVKAMRVKESLIHFECIYRDHLSYGDTPGAGQIITAEVVKIHVDESIYDDGRIITKKFKPLGRGAGNDWIRVTDVFELQRLMASQIQK